jgi:DNA uptake protein ComE-like DNA-binding protein
MILRMQRRWMLTRWAQMRTPAERGCPSRSGFDDAKSPCNGYGMTLPVARAAAGTAALRGRRRASILVGLLWCMALLSIVVISVLHTARLDLLVQKNYGDRIQAHYLALAGIEKAKALLYQDLRDRQRARKNHTGDLYDDATDFKEVQFGRGKFNVFRPASESESGEVVYGISDEESRLNVNYAAAEDMAKLPGMTPEIVAAIMDWRDEDHNVSPGGAEAEYYTSLKPPYLPRDGTIQTTRELLMVRGISNQLLLGDGENFPDLPDTNEPPAEASQTIGDRGWDEFLCVSGWAINVDAAGDDRVNAQSADEKTLSGVKGITQEIARAIVAYRGQNQLQTLADLLDVTARQNQPGQTGQNQGQQAGPKVINEDLFLEIADDVCVDSAKQQPGPVNINTANAQVLTCLPGMTPEVAQALVSYRRSIGFFPNVAWLLKTPGMTRDIFKQMVGRVTARSDTFRIISEGKVASSGARQRIMAVVQISKDELQTLSWREDL